MYVSKDALNHFSVHSSAESSLRKSQKRGIFLILHFGRHAHSPAAPLSYATDHGLYSSFQTFPAV